MIGRDQLSDDVRRSSAAADGAAQRKDRLLSRLPRSFWSLGFLAALGVALILFVGCSSGASSSSSDDTSVASDEGGSDEYEEEDSSEESDSGDSEYEEEGDEEDYEEEGDEEYDEEEEEEYEEEMEEDEEYEEEEEMEEEYDEEEDEELEEEMEEEEDEEYEEEEEGYEGEEGEGYEGEEGEGGARGGKPSFPEGSPEAAVVEFIMQMRGEADAATLEKIIGADATGILADARAGKLSEEKAKELKEAVARVKLLQSRRPRLVRGGRQISVVSTATGKVLQFICKRSEGGFTLNELKIVTPSTRGRR